LGWPSHVVPKVEAKISVDFRNIGKKRKNMYTGGAGNNFTP